MGDLSLANFLSAPRPPPLEGSLLSAMVCTLLPGVFGALLQGILFLGACGALALKRSFDDGSRSLLSFLADSSKQVWGAGWVHVLNIGLALAFQERIGGGDACDWYWINIVVDCTLGVLVEFALLSVCLQLLVMIVGDAAAEEFRGGHYYECDGDLAKVRFRWSRYVKQVALWLAVVTGMKLAISFLMVTFRKGFLGLAELCIGGLTDQWKLPAVMVLTPFCMNSLQFWLVDGIIRKGGGGESEGASVLRPAKAEVVPQGPASSLESLDER